MKGVIGRFFLLWFYLKNSQIRKRVKIRSLLFHFFLKKCDKIASKYILDVVEEGDFNKYKFSEIDGFLFLRKDINIHSLYQVISEGMLSKHWHYYEIPETKVEKNDVVVDCGSAEGFFSFKNKNKAKKVYLIEPNRIYNLCLNQTFKESLNCEILNCAVGDKVSNVSFVETKNNIDSFVSVVENETLDTSQYDIKMETIDNLFFKKNIKINYIKADIEGFEEQMLIGAKQTIIRDKPKIAVTVYHWNQNYQNIINIVKSYVSEYKLISKGVESYKGNPVMLHFYI